MITIRKFPRIHTCLGELDPQFQQTFVMWFSAGSAVGQDREPDGTRVAIFSAKIVRGDSGMAQNLIVEERRQKGKTYKGFHKLADIYPSLV